MKSEGGGVKEDSLMKHVLFVMEQNITFGK